MVEPTKQRRFGCWRIAIAIAIARAKTVKPGAPIAIVRARRSRGKEWAHQVAMFVPAGHPDGRFGGHIDANSSPSS